ncbi:MAG TPA: hypothetical protein VGC49_06565 [Solirubrobacterales bacterium]|jgi:hypothetical protein
MTAENQNPEAKAAEKPEASEVVAEAIAAMRDDAIASAAADAVERAWKGGKFDVDRALQEIEVPKESHGDKA